MTARTCQQCHHWHERHCYAHPPQIVLWPTDNQHPIMYAPVESQPGVMEDERACGEFKDKEDVTPDRCEPPDGMRHHRWHWLRQQDSAEASPAHWSFGAWFIMTWPGPILPEEMHAAGWRYRAPCIPPAEGADAEG
jgi:hypothetical protein